MFQHRNPSRNEVVLIDFYAAEPIQDSPVAKVIKEEDLNHLTPLCHTAPPDYKSTFLHIGHAATLKINTL